MNLFHKLVRVAGRQEWFARLGPKVAPWDLRLQDLTRGRVNLGELLGVPALLLTTTGRRSGVPRSVPLLYVPHEDGFIVTASNWGRAHHPAWSANLLAEPLADVLVRGRHVRVRARLVTGDERARLWRRITPVWPAFDTYVTRSGGREFRLFVLSRV
ncbi:nitroreductase family deazaflavin-dependent oxidoreductase [Saccharothrix syringae]|uniref:Nitroreductase family deazaflavin-dependent oxidoreductase n=1 Tax=Saccharothrix syringae TaxID=103733 RepID=A0A5Q0GYF9_SACSY|nr:nitroreductase family deazaflavin-dependent oxidoreductase [Saccharothrix syringae]QFZ18999.1 nitroreductase family deazaflavin-dependent oxidoreductase [Saccharothrix syringae]